MGGLLKTAQYIESELSSMGLTPERQAFEVNGLTYFNVVVRFKGAAVMTACNPSQASHLFVVGAHYDAFEGLPAADDNASGVAGLIELARMLKNKAEQPLAHPIELVFYTLEEPPYFRTKHMGSAVHAASLKQKGERVRLMISLEMIGYFSDVPNSQSYPIKAMGLGYPTVGNFIAVIGRFDEIPAIRTLKASMQAATTLPIYSMNAPTWVPGIDFSDHMSYWNEGFIGLMITDTSFYRNKAYHTAEDTYDRLDYGRMAEVVKATYSALIHAQAEIR